MKNTYCKTFCLLAGTTLFTGCLTTSVEQAPKEQEVAAAPTAHAQPDAVESNMAVGGAVHHGVVALGSEAQFATAIAHGNVVVDVFATWCGPCKRLAPILESLAADYGTNVQFIKIDADRFPSIAQQQGVSGYPTLLFFKDGKKIHSKVGGDSKAGLKQLIDSAFGL